MTTKNEAAQALGRKGGEARAKKHSKEQLSKWAKKGGRPKKKIESVLATS